MNKPRKLRIKASWDRYTEKLVAKSKLVDFDWLNKSRSRAKDRIATLVQLLKESHDLLRRLRDKPTSLATSPDASHLLTASNATSPDAKQLLNNLERVNEIMRHYQGVKVFLVCDYQVIEIFHHSSKAHGTEIGVLNFALQLFKNGSIERLRNCAECGKWCYAATHHQAYCGPACRQRHASHDGVFKKRRREYMRAYRAQENNRDAIAASLARRAKR